MKLKLICVIIQGIGIGEFILYFAILVIVSKLIAFIINKLNDKFKNT